MKRPDADELLRIRAGEVSYDALIEEVESLDAQCDVLYKESDALPREPNRKKIDQFIVKLTESYLKYVGC